MAKSILKKEPDTVRTRRWQDTLERVIVSVISILVFLAFGYVAIMSIIQTSVIDPQNYVNEHILFNADNALLSGALTVLFFIFIMTMKRRFDFFARVNMTFMEVGMVVFVLALGLFWVLRVQSIPAADSANIFDAASGAARGDYTALQSNDLFHNHDYYGNNSYFMFYPFQLGFVFLSELIYRVFGADTAMPLEIINVVCVAMAYLGIAKVTKTLFSRRAIEFVAILLLIGCLQPIFFTTFAYGNVMGMCFAVWACYFLIRYFKENRWMLLIPSGVLLVLSTLAKYNNMIYLVAFVIVLLIHAIKEKKWQSLAFILAICVCTVGASKLIIMMYENRADQKYTSGVSQTLYLDLGLQESYMAPGWYTSIGLTTFKESNFDSEVANAKAKEDIQTRLDVFKNDPDYAIDFFSKKVLSQWNEPTYESIWVSKVKSHYNGEVTGFVKTMYDYSVGQLYDFYCNAYVQVLLILFALGALALTTTRKMNICTVLLPLVLLGGFGYHLLFEGKSQYILTYIILMIPTAAWVAMTLIESKRNIFANVGKYVPQDGEEPAEIAEETVAVINEPEESVEKIDEEAPAEELVDQPEEAVEDINDIPVHESEEGEE